MPDELADQMIAKTEELVEEKKGPEAVVEAVTRLAAAAVRRREQTSTEPVHA